MRIVRAIVVVVEMQWELQVCVYSLSYSTCKAQSPYCHLWPLRFYRIFPHYLTNGTIFGSKPPNTKCVFWFYLQVLSQTYLILI